MATEHDLLTPLEFFTRMNGPWADFMCYHLDDEQREVIFKFAAAYEFWQSRAKESLRGEDQA